jgi:hypothetical protein
MKTYGGVEVRLQLHTLLTSELYGGEWSAWRSGRLTPGKQPPRRTEKSLTLSESEARFAGLPAHGLVTILTELFRFPSGKLSENYAHQLVCCYVHMYFSIKVEDKTPGARIVQSV